MTLPGLLSVTLVVLLAWTALFSTLVMAQDSVVLVGDPERGKVVFQRVGYCVSCHGWAGDGGMGRNPMAHAAAANLRETGLDGAGLTEVIKCGLPGTKMPYHDSGAYMDDRCYGTVMSDYEAGDAPIRGKTFNDQQTANLVAYLETRMIGLGKPTYNECADYYGTSADKACGYLKSE